jgi:hypothetical protein
MGSSGLFEAWRVIQAEALVWFYEETGGNFDYWPEGLDGPMLSERSPFGNVAVIADNDRMYHRIGPVGDPHGSPPRISASASAGWRWPLGDRGERRSQSDLSGIVPFACPLSGRRRFGIGS